MRPSLGSACQARKAASAQNADRDHGDCGSEEDRSVVAEAGEG
jgi:hypothetical protein